MDKLFLTVLNMSLTGAFVIAAVILARIALKKAPKIISYCLWAVVGFRLICPFTMDSVFSLIPFETQQITDAGLLDDNISFSATMGTVNQAIGDIANGGLGILSITTGREPDGTRIITQTLHYDYWFLFFGKIWFPVVLVMLLYGIISYVLLKRRMRTAIRTHGNIYETDNIQSPFVLGFIKPKIYLPLSLAAGEREYIILHERTHIRRHDHLVKFAAYFILCLHWFNPLAWVAFLLMGVDMEMSCDERVLKEMGGETKHDYSRSLLSLATGRRVIGGSPLAFGEGGVKERIKNVLNFKKPSRVIVIAAVALVAVLSVGFAVNRATNGNTLIFKDLGLDFTNIEITNTTSEWGSRTLDAEKTDELCQVIWNIQFVKDSKYNGQFDSMFRLKFLLGAEEVEEIYVLSNNAIVYNGNIYKTTDGYIDLEYMENLNSQNSIESQSIGTTYSPDGKYFIEGYGVDYETQVSGLNPVKQFRIVETGSKKTIWSKEGPFLFDSLPPFAWSTDSRYVYIAYAGRIWKDGLLVDTVDMSEHSLPGITELARLFPDTTPEDNRPDPYIVPFMWLESHKLLVTFSWRVKEDVIDEDNRIYGEYVYNADNGDFSLREDFGERYAGSIPTVTPNEDIVRKVEDGLQVIMSSPQTSSNPQDYISEHWQEYENLTAKFPDGVLDYLLSQFEAGNTDGLRGQIMMRMCKDMLGLQNNVTDESLSPQEWYKQLAIIGEIKLPDFKPENLTDKYTELGYSAITQYYSKPDSGFLVAAPTVYGEYEEEGKLKIIMMVSYERYRLYGETLESTGGGVIPGAAIFRKAESNGEWIFEEYIEVGSGNLPDGMYYNDSIKKLCVMPVSGNEIKALAEKMSSDYGNDTRHELLAQNLKEHLLKHGQIGVSIRSADGILIELT